MSFVNNVTKKIDFILRLFIPHLSRILRGLATGAKELNQFFPQGQYSVERCGIYKNVVIIRPPYGRSPEGRQRLFWIDKVRQVGLE